MTPGNSGGMPSIDPNMAMGMARAKLAADLNADPQAAASQYAAIVANFDAQRQGAAQAIFGLGEAYRKMGRVVEARVQYGRILREFVDYPELARQSQRQLAGLSAPAGGGDLVNPTPTLNPETWREERDLLNEHLKLLEEELTNVKMRISSGAETPSASIPLQREMLRIRQELLRFPKEDRKPSDGREAHTEPPPTEGSGRTPEPRSQR